MIGDCRRGIDSHQSGTAACGLKSSILNEQSQMKTVAWRGVFPAVCTQFHADQGLNVAGTLAHIEAMLAAGVHGLVMMGTVGENCSLEPAEKRELLKATVQHVGRR